MMKDDEANNQSQQPSPQSPAPVPSVNAYPNVVGAETASPARTRAADDEPHYVRHMNITNESNRRSAPTISALVRGLHQTVGQDVRALQLPLFYTDDEEDEDYDKDNDRHQKQRKQRKVKLVKSKSKELVTKNTQMTPNHNHQHYLNSPNSLTALSPKKHSELSPHSSLPRLIINIDPASDNNNCDNTQKLNDSELPTSPGRRFSQFNFHLRRFSHAHNTVFDFTTSLLRLCLI